MKCICGYEHQIVYIDGIEQTTVGDEEFIEINVNATRESTGWHRGLIDVSVYACPKCGTLRCDLY